MQSPFPPPGCTMAFKPTSLPCDPGGMSAHKPTSPNQNKNQRKVVTSPCAVPLAGRFGGMGISHCRCPARICQKLQWVCPVTCSKTCCVFLKDQMGSSCGETGCTIVVMTGIELCYYSCLNLHSHAQPHLRQHHYLLHIDSTFTCSLHPESEMEHC